MQREEKYLTVIGSHAPLGSGQGPTWFSSLYLAHVWLHGCCLCTAVATSRTMVLTDRLNCVSEPKGHGLRVGKSSLVHEVTAGR